MPRAYLGSVERSPSPYFQFAWCARLWFVGVHRPSMILALRYEGSWILFTRLLLIFQVSQFPQGRWRYYRMPSEGLLPNQFPSKNLTHGFLLAYLFASSDWHRPSLGSALGTGKILFVLVCTLGAGCETRNCWISLTLRELQTLSSACWSLPFFENSWETTNWLLLQAKPLMSASSRIFFKCFFCRRWICFLARPGRYFCLNYPRWMRSATRVTKPPYLWVQSC